MFYPRNDLPRDICDLASGLASSDHALRNKVGAQLVLIPSARFCNVDIYTLQVSVVRGPNRASLPPMIPKHGGIRLNLESLGENFCSFDKLTLQVSACRKSCEQNFIHIVFKVLCETRLDLLRRTDAMTYAAIRAPQGPEESNEPARIFADRFHQLSI
jgi:hypothetical protein